MKKILCLVLSLIIVAGFVFSFAGCDNEEDGDVIKIGSIHPLTGSMAYEGQAFVNSQKIAIDKINAEGGINGKMLELKAIDSLGTAGGAATAAQKLINMNVCALTGTYTSGSAQVVSRTAEKFSIPFVVTVAAMMSLIGSATNTANTLFSKKFGKMKINGISKISLRRKAIIKLIFA